MDNELKEFEEILKLLLVSNNETRNQAEKHYSELIEQNPEICTRYLLGMVPFSTEKNVKSLSLVLFRRAIISLLHPIWEKFSKNHQNLIKSSLIELLGIKLDRYTKKLVCDAIVSVRSKDDGWKDLVATILEFTQSSDENSQYLGLYTLHELCRYCSLSLGKKHVQIEKLVRTFLNSENVSLEVQMCGTKLISTLILVVPKNKHSGLRKFTPDILNLLGKLVSNNEYDLAESLLKDLLDVCEISVSLFDNHVKQVLNGMIELASLPSGIEIDPLRYFALELLYEILQRNTTKALRAKGYLSEMIKCSLKFIAEIDPENSDLKILRWIGEKQVSFSEITSVDVGSALLDKISILLGGEKVLSLIFEHIPDMLNSEKWTWRFAGLNAIMSISEGCKEQMTGKLKSVLELLLPHANDQQLPVSFQAIMTLGQLCDDFSPLIQEQFHATIFPLLVDQLKANFKNFNNSSNTDFNYLIHVTLCSMINFVEGLDEGNSIKIIELYFDDTVGLLTELLQNNEEIHISETCVTCLASLILSSKGSDLFLNHFEQIGTLFFTLLDNTQNESNLSVLRGKTFEALSVIGETIGVEKFEPIVEQLYQNMIETQKGIYDQNISNGQLVYILRAWSRLSEHLSSTLIPYLEYLIPIILTNIEERTEFVLLKDLENKNEKEQEQQEKGLRIFHLGEQKIGVKTSVLQERKDSLNLLFKICKNLSINFSPYILKTAQVCIPQLECYSHEDVRLFASMIIPEIIKICIQSLKENLENADPKILKELIQVSILRLTQACSKEEIVDILSVQLQSLGESISHGNEALEKDQILSVIAILPPILLASQDRIAVLIKTIQENQSQISVEEENLIADQIGNEHELMYFVASVLDNLLKFHFDSCWDYFQENLLNYYLLTLKPEHGVTINTSAVYVLDAVAEYGGEIGFQTIWSDFGPFLLDFILDQDTSLRQASAYGLGICAQIGGDRFSKISKRAAQTLVKAIKKFSLNSFKNMDLAEEEIEELGLCAENLISALGKTCFYHHSKNDLNKFILNWVDFLPLSLDDEQAKINHHFICEYINSNNVSFVGKNFQNLSKILSVLLSVYFSDLSTQTIGETVQSLAKNIKQDWEEKKISNLLNKITNKELSQKFLQIMKEI
ncbi:karyopherin (importin) beta [Anaeramoeba flamelloides]|uniref:Karyopherin (Importin) beta n=1 Tax=Anaeramoeba flamelloides TaxID=1746091 RepID=A0AAV7YXH4_9EUKA|nr:karyopherin (importin) beta [Anaeramoeba flamelloides]